jgi:hypothetical protein
MAQKKNPSRQTERNTTRKPARTTSLAAFFGNLARRPELLEKFSWEPTSRRAVLDSFKLSAEHRKMLAEGSADDIMVQLSGPRPAGPGQMVVVLVDSFDAPCCGHTDCKAFLAASKPS